MMNHDIKRSVGFQRSPGPSNHGARPSGRGGVNGIPMKKVPKKTLSIPWQGRGVIVSGLSAP